MSDPLPEPLGEHRTAIGLLVLAIGLVLWLLGAMGHAVRGRKHYF
jgi:hypothetical protein